MARLEVAAVDIAGKAPCATPILSIITQRDSSTIHMSAKVARTRDVHRIRLFADAGSDEQS